jgi:hypothetical protein
MILDVHPKSRIQISVLAQNPGLQFCEAHNSNNLVNLDEKRHLQTKLFHFFLMKTIDKRLLLGIKVVL